MASEPAQAISAITWRDGVHITGTPIWCDARRTRDVCFVSCAHAVPGSRHGQLIGTAATLELLGPQTSGSQLPVPYGRPFSLGTVRLELLRSGHALGSASLLADVDDLRVLYAGAVNTRGGGLGGMAELRRCDALVVSARYGDPTFHFPPTAEIVDQVAGFVQDVTTRGGVAILLVTSPGKALDVSSRLTDRLGELLPHTALPSIYAHRSFYDASLRLRATLPALPRVKRFGRPPSGHVLLWPAQRRDAVPAELPQGSRIALISGLAMDPNATARLDVSAAYPWSNQADHRELLEYIESSTATRIFLTDGRSSALVDAVTQRKRSAHLLGPPQQMSLF